MQVSKHAGKGLFNFEPTTPAPAELIRLLPILKLPHRAAAAPTIQPKLASAILDELPGAGGDGLVRSSPKNSSRGTVLDTSLLVSALSSERGFVEARRRAGRRDAGLLPSAARKAIATAWAAKPIWLLHQAQLAELRAVIDNLLDYSLAVANGLRTPHPDQTLLDQSAILNAVELVEYLHHLEWELCTTHRPDVCYIRNSRHLGLSGSGRRRKLAKGDAIAAH